MPILAADLLLEIRVILEEFLAIRIRG